MLNTIRFGAIYGLYTPIPLSNVTSHFKLHDAATALLNHKGADRVTLSQSLRGMGVSGQDGVFQLVWTGKDADLYEKFPVNDQFFRRYLQDVFGPSAQYSKIESSSEDGGEHASALAAFENTMRQQLLTRKDITKSQLIERVDTVHSWLKTFGEQFNETRVPTDADYATFKTQFQEYLPDLLLYSAAFGRSMNAPYGTPAHDKRKQDSKWFDAASGHLSADALTHMTKAVSSTFSPVNVYCDLSMPELIPDGPTPHVRATEAALQGKIPFVYADQVLEALPKKQFEIATGTFLNKIA